MKKTLTLFVLLFTTMILVSCKNQDDKFVIIYNEILESQHFDESIEISNDFLLMEKSDLIEDVYLSYDSNNPAVLKIESYQAVVKQQTENIDVKLIIRITLDNITKVFELDLIVLKSEINSNLYNVRYLLDGKTYQSIAHEKDSKLVLPPAPFKSNHIFIGWETEGEIINEDYTINSNITLNAVFNNLDERNIINTKDLNFNGKTGLSCLEITPIINDDNEGLIIIIINDEVVEELHIKSSEIVLRNYQVLNEFKLEIKLSANISISNIKIIDNDIIDNLRDDFHAIKLDKEFYKETKIELPLKGLRSSTFTWSLKSLENKVYIDLENGLIKPPSDKLINVDLVIKIEYLGVVLIKEIKLSIGKPNLVSLDKISLLKNGQTAQVIGQVLAIYKLDKEVNYLIVDKNNNRAKIKSGIVTKIRIGDEVTFTGVIKSYSFYFGDYEVTEKNLKVEKNLLLSQKDLQDNLHGLVYLEGIAINNITNNEFYLYLDEKIKIINLSNEYINITKGDYVEVSGFVVKRGNELVVCFNYRSNVSQMNISNEHIVNLIMKGINLNELITYPIKANQELPLTDPIFNSGLIWHSDHENYFSISGVYNAPPEIIKSKLLLTIKLDGKVIGTREFKIIIYPN